MAEAVGLAASVIAIVQLSAKLAQLCRQYYTGVNNAESDIKRLINAAEGLGTSLQGVQKLLEGPNREALPTSQKLLDSLKECITELEQVRNRLDPGKRRKTMSRFGLRALKWPFQSSEVGNVICSLERHQQTITLGLQVDQTSLLIEIKQGVEGLSLQTQEAASTTGKPCFIMPFDRDPDFVDRPDIIAWMKEQYTGPTNRMALFGMGGFGKSQVAIQFAHHIHETSPQTSVIWVHASSEARFEEAYRSIADSLQIPGRDHPVTDLLGLVRDWLQREDLGPWLVVIDNADNVNVFHAGPRPLASRYLLHTHNQRALLESSEKALRWATPILGKDHPNMAANVNFLTQAYSQLGRAKEAETLGLQALESQKRLLGDEHPDTLDCLGILVEVIRKAGRLEEAAELGLRALELSRKALGERNIDTLHRMATLASIRDDQGRFKEAEELQLLALEVATSVLGEDHPDSLASMNNLALLYESQGRMEEAEKLHVKGLEVSSRVLGKDHPEVVTSLSNMALLYRSHGRYQEAEELGSRVVGLQKRILGEEHPDTLASMDNLAVLYESQGRYQEAEELGSRVLESFKRILGEDHPRTLTSMNNLAAFFNSQGRYQEAEELVSRVLESRKKILGEDHPGTLASMNNLASVYYSQGRYQEAEELHAKEFKASSMVLGDGHPNTLTSMANLAIARESLGRLGGALTLMQRSAEGHERVLGPNHPDTKFVLRRLERLRNKASTATS